MLACDKPHKFLEYNVGYTETADLLRYNYIILVIVFTLLIMFYFMNIVLQNKIAMTEDDYVSIMQQMKNDSNISSIRLNSLTKLLIVYYVL